MSGTQKTLRTPKTVSKGQIWKDNDQRSAGTGEFLVLQVSADLGLTGELYARVHRYASKRESFIRVDRFFVSGSRGYTYLGRKK